MQMRGVYEEERKEEEKPDDPRQLYANEIGTSRWCNGFLRKKKNLRTQARFDFVYSTHIYSLIKDNPSLLKCKR